MVLNDTPSRDGVSACRVQLFLLALLGGGGGLPRFTSGLGAKFMRFRATRSIDEGLEGPTVFAWVFASCAQVLL